MTPAKGTKKTIIGRVGLLAAALALALGTVGCGDSTPPPEEPIETVDIAAPPVIDPDADLKALRPQARVTGTLPSAFPREVPLHSPSTVVASGGGGGEAVWVELKTSDSAVRVRQQLGARLRAADWAGSVEGDTSFWTRDGQRLTLAIFAEADGTARYRLSIQ